VRAALSNPVQATQETRSLSSACHCSTVAERQEEWTRCKTNGSLGAHASLVTVGIL